MKSKPSERRKSEKTQGEGDRTSARRYNRKTEEFVAKRGKSAQRGPKLNRKDSENIAKAEKAARKRIKEKDPQVARDYTNKAGR